MKQYNILEDLGEKYSRMPTTKSWLSISSRRILVLLNNFRRQHYGAQHQHPKMRPEGQRPSIVGSDAGPEAPFPLRMNGKVVSGFGRGSKEVSNKKPPTFQSLKRPISVQDVLYVFTIC